MRNSDLLLQNGTNTVNSHTKAHVQLSIMGHFALHINGQPLSELDNHFSKRRSIVTYLILHRNRAVSYDELLRTFYEDNDTGNPLASLKMQIARIRKRIKECLGEELDAIIGKRGFYQWNQALTCWVDIEVFEDLCFRAQSDVVSNDEMLSLYSQALKMYNGSLVLEKDDFLWGKVVCSHFHTKYITAVERYADLLIQNKCYDAAEDVYLKAIEQDPTNEILYALLIRLLTNQNRFSEAKAWYKNIEDTLYTTLGVHPSVELQQLYSECIEAQLPGEQNLSRLMAEMQETNEARGAFACSFEQFKNIYQLEVRRSNRDGGCLHIVLLTVLGFDGNALSLDVGKIIMARVKQTIMLNLRQSDVLAQPNAYQFIIMLPYSNLEDSQMVVDRIIKAYPTSNPRNAIQFSYQLQGLE